MINRIVFIATIFLICNKAYNQSLYDYGVSITNNVPFNTIYDEPRSYFDWSSTSNYALYSDDYVSKPTNIGFNFNYKGVNYSKFRISVNGFITFDTITVPTYGYNGAYTYESYDSQFEFLNGTNLALAVFYEDLAYSAAASLDSVMSYRISGVAPHRKLTIEWRNVGSLYYSYTRSFQIVLNEHQGKIEYLYGNSYYSYYEDPIIGINDDEYESNPQSIPEFLTLDEFSMDQNIARTNYVNFFNKIDTNMNVTFQVGLPPCSSVENASHLIFTQVGHTQINGKFNRSPDAEYYKVIRTSSNTQPSENGGKIISESNDTTFIDLGLSSSTTYYYWVFAYKSFNCSGSRPATTTPISNSATTMSCTQSGGTYSIGNTGAYTTIGSALNYLNSTGIAGPIILQLQPSYNPALELYPLILKDSIPCMSEINTITVRPGASVASMKNFSSSDTLATFLFDNGSHFIFDGRPGGVGTNKFINIENSNLEGNAIYLMKNADNNIFRFCTIKGINNKQDEGVINIKNTPNLETCPTLNSFESEPGPSGNVFSNCNISDGVTTPANLVYSKACIKNFGSLDYEDIEINHSNVIEFCNLSNFFQDNNHSNAIKLADGNANWSIKKNSFFQSTNRTLNGNYVISAINIGRDLFGEMVGGDHTVTNNYIGGSQPICAGSKFSLNGAGRFIAMQVNSYGYTDEVCDYWDYDDCSDYIYSSHPSYADSNVIKNIAVSSSTISDNEFIQLGSGSIDFKHNAIGGQSNFDSIKISYPNATGFSLIKIKSYYSSEVDEIAIMKNKIQNIHLTTNGKANIILGTGSVASGHSFKVQNNLIGDSASINNNITINAPTESRIISNELNDYSASAECVISDNQIYNITNLNTSPNFSIIYDVNDSPEIFNNVIKNCIANTAISSLDYVNGIHISSTSAITQNTIVKNNIIENIGVNSNTAWCNVNGIISYTGIIEQNRINGLFNNSSNNLSEVRGILMNSNATVKNNSIRLGLDYNGNNLSSPIIFSGIYGESQGTISSKVYNNSIYIGGSNTSTANTYSLNMIILPNSPQEIYNNIFVNERFNLSTGRNYCINYTYSGSYGGSLYPYINANRNLYYSNGTGTYFARFKSNTTTSFTNIAAWRNYAREDTLSSFHNPNFINATGNAATYNLHLNSLTSAESLGKTLSSVSFDIDNESRNASSPDAGMDEGNFTAIDVTQPIISYTALKPSCTTSGRIINATITDITGIPITGSNRPRIYYAKNTTTTFHNRPGVLQSGNGQNGEWTFPIIALDMGGLADGDVVYYFVVAQDTSAQDNFGSYPYGAFGPTTDSITYQPFSLFSYLVSSATAMGGNINVGIGQTYTTLEAAITSYNSACIQDDIVFLLTDSIYTVSSTISIINNVTASENSTLTIRPTKINTVVSGSSTTSLFLFNAAKHIIIDGNIGGNQVTLCSNSQPIRNLTIKNNSTGPIIGLTNSSTSERVENCTIKNCIILGNGTTTAYGIQLFSSTSANAMRHYNNVIESNSIGGVNIGISAIGLSTSYRSEKIFIRNNEFNMPAPNSIRENAICVNYFNDIEILKNKISRLRRTDATDIAGIVVGLANSNGVSLNSLGAQNSYSNFKISGNEIDSIVSTGQASAVGILIGYQNLGNNIIDNNMISHVSSNANNTGSPSSNIAAGIFICNVLDNDTFLVINNTVVMQGTIEGTAPATGFSSCFYTTSANKTNIKNNIFINVQKGNAGATMKMYSMVLYDLSIENNLLSDNNNLYSKATGPGIYNLVGTSSFPFTDFDTLSEWQAYAQRDTLSINQFALFQAHNNLRLRSHSYNSGFDNSGIPFTTYDYDIDCNQRSSITTDIGADEFVSCLFNQQTSLAGVQGSTINLTQDVNMSFYFHEDCKPIAYIEPALVFPVTGNIDVSLTLSDTNLIYNGRTLGKRYYDISPHTSPSLSTAKVTLYFTQEEFNSYNLENGNYLELPSSRFDTMGIKNIRILQYHGNSYNGLPNGYNGILTEIDPANTSVKYVSKLQAWAITINVYGFSGFYLSSAAPTCRTSDIKYVSNIIGTTYQWQVNIGSGYTNLANGGVYSGVTNDTLTISSPPITYRGYKYRCVTNGINGQENELLFFLKWKGTTNVNWSTAANWGCTTLPDIYTDVLIDSATLFSPQVNIIGFARTLKLTPGANLQINLGRTLKVEIP